MNNKITATVFATVFMLATIPVGSSGICTNTTTTTTTTTTAVASTTTHRVVPLTDV